MRDLAQPILLERPRIGLPLNEIYDAARPNGPLVQGQHVEYMQAIRDGGGIPVPIPLTNDEYELYTFYQSIDGLLLPGGNDVDPRSYGEKPDIFTEPIPVLRGLVELRLLDWVEADRKPLLTVCRGTQLWNVRNEGTLYLHLPRDFPHHPGKEKIDHINKGKEIRDRRHPLIVDRATEFGRILLQGIEDGALIRGDSHHHQAIKKVGDELRVVAIAPDGVVEAIETTREGWWAKGTQWHIESRDANFFPGTEIDPLSLHLLKAFVDASRKQPLIMKRAA